MINSDIVFKDISTILWTDKFPFSWNILNICINISMFLHSSDVTAISFEERVFENGFDCLI